MKKNHLLFLALNILFATGSCTSPSEKLQKCISEYFKFVPLDCPYNAADPNYQRDIEVEQNGELIEVRIEIAECRNDLELYFGWIAAEIQASCNDDKKVEYFFCDNELNPYFSLPFDSIPYYVTKDYNRDAYFDKNISKTDKEVIEAILFSDEVSTETTFRVFQRNGTLNIGVISHILAGDREGIINALSDVFTVKSVFDDNGIEQKIVYHVLDSYGRIIDTL